MPLCVGCSNLRRTRAVVSGVVSWREKKQMQPSSLSRLSAAPLRPFHLAGLPLPPCSFAVRSLSFSLLLGGGDSSAPPQFGWLGLEMARWWGVASDLGTAVGGLVSRLGE